MKFEELQEKIIKWGKDRDLLKQENAPKQFMKFIEESGELARGILKDDKELITDSIGDVLVTLIILSEQLGYDMTACLGASYLEIKDRKGETVNGTFIKQ